MVGKALSTFHTQFTQSTHTPARARARMYMCVCVRIYIYTYSAFYTLPVEVYFSRNRASL